MKKVMLVIAFAGLAIAQVNAQTEPAKTAAPAKKATTEQADGKEHKATAHKSAKPATHQVKKEEKSTMTATPAAKPATKPAPAKAAPAPATK